MLMLSSLDNGFGVERIVPSSHFTQKKTFVSFLKIIIVLLRYTYIDAAGGGNFSWHFACAFFLTAVVQALMQFIADLL